MVYGLDTPRAEVTVQSVGDMLDLGSLADSFKSPGHDRNVLKGMDRGRRTSGHRSASTPLRSITGGTKRLSNGKEFTPMLKSVHMSQMKSKVRDRFPDSPIPGADDPNETFPSGNTTGVKLPDSSSIVTTPGTSFRRRRGRGKEESGLLQGEGQLLSLKEQERMIDEVKKENFGLKMKLVLLEDRLKHQEPENVRRAIKENIEIKVESEGLKVDLKRYKRSLNQSEKQISELRRELAEMESRADREFRNGRRGEEIDKLLQEAMEKLEEKELELDAVLDENEKLKDEADQYFDKLNQLEHGEVEEFGKLKKQVEQLLGEKEDLESEVRQAQATAEEKEDEVDGLKHDLREKELELKELQLNRAREIGDKEREVRELERVTRELKSQADRLKEEKLGVEGDMDGALKTAHARIDTLQDTISTLQTQLQKETSSKSQVTEEQSRLETRCSKLEEEKRQLELRYEQMEDEKDTLDFERRKLEAENQKLIGERNGLEDDLENLRDEMQNKSFSYKSRVTERDDARKEIQQELAAVKQEYNELQDLHKEKVRECRNLEHRVKELNGEFDGEAQALQDRLDILQREKDITTKAHKELEQELRKVKSELHNTTTEKDLLQHRYDALTLESSGLQRDIAKLKANIRELNAALQHEREAAAVNEQAWGEELQTESDRFTEALERAKATLEERRQQSERALDDWNLEKRQLEARAEKAENTARSLRNTIDHLQQMEQGLQGKEQQVHRAFHEERDRHHQAEQSLNNQVKDLSEEIERRKKTLEQKINECNTLREEIRQSKKSEKALEEKVRLLDDEIEVLGAELEEAGKDNNKDLVILRSECEALRKKLATTKQELTRIENENIHAKADMQTIKVDLEAEVGTLNQLKIQLQEANRRLEAAQKDKKLLQEQLEKANTQANAIRTVAVDIEAERDELWSRLKDHVDVDTEKMDLRKARSKLELDLQRVRDERGLYAEKVQQLETELEDAFTNATKEQVKLEKQIWELQTQLKAAVESREREASAAKRNISRLEKRIEELMHIDGHDSGLDLELATVREHLAEARRRESEVLQKETQSRRMIRELRMKVDNLEKDLMDVQNEAAMRTSPSLMNTPAGRKSEVEDLRQRLQSSNEQIKEYRMQVRTLERAANSQKSAYEKLDYEKQLLEQELADCRASNDELVHKGLGASSAIGSLRHKILQLEKGLNDAKIGKQLRGTEAGRPVQQQVAEERQELHQHLKQATLEIEQLQGEVEMRNEEIRGHLKRQRELESQLRGAKREKDRVDADVQVTANELRKITAKYQKAKEKTLSLQQAWDSERKTIAQRVRMNAISSGTVDKTDKEIEVLEKAITENESRHAGELKGLVRQIRYLKANVAREQGFRQDLSFAKNFFLMQINLYSTCNQANLQMIERMGIYPDRTIREKRPTLRAVVQMAIAAIRMRRRKEAWEVNKEMQMQLAKTLERQRRRGSGRMKELVV